MSVIRSPKRSLVLVAVGALSAGLLAQKRRLFALADVIRAFEGLAARHHGQIAADVTSARPLSAEETADLKRMLKDKQGRIVNITSIVGLTGNPGQSNYSAAKAGLLGFTKSLAQEVASRNITVNAVAPGFIDTDMTRALSDAQRANLMKGIPMARLGSAADVAAAVAFLVSPQAAYITGETLHVNGGMYMA